MDINEITSSLKSGFVIKTIADNEWEILTNISLPNGFKSKVFIKQINGKWFFTDKKNVLKFMNEIYELSSNDVKNCIAGVLRAYGFSITSGEIFAHIYNEKEILIKFYQFICCMAELVNMYVFFDKP